MKTVLFALLPILLIGVIGFIATGASAPMHPGFSERDLRGVYSFSLQGEAVSGPSLGPVTTIGVFKADGHGNIPFATRSINVNGVVIDDDTASGTYTVDPSGVGSATFFPTSGAPAETFDFVFVNPGHLLSAARGPVIVGEGVSFRQSR